MLEQNDNRWEKVIDQGGKLYWSDSSRGMPKPGMLYIQILTPLSDGEIQQYRTWFSQRENLGER